MESIGLGLKIASITELILLISLELHDREKNDLFPYLIDIWRTAAFDAYQKNTHMIVSWRNWRHSSQTYQLQWLKLFILFR